MSDVTTNQQQAVALPESSPRPVRRRRRNQRGMTTAEYAVGTVAAVSFAGVLIKVLTDPSIQKLLFELVLWIIKLVTGF